MNSVKILLMAALLWTAVPTTARAADGQPLTRDHLVELLSDRHHVPTPGELDPWKDQVEPLLRAIAADRQELIFRRVRAVHLLQYFGSDKESAALLESMAADPQEQPAVRGTSMTSLGKLRGGDALPTLTRGIGDDDPYIRNKAAQALRRLDGPEAAKLVGSAEAKGLVYPAAE